MGLREDLLAKFARLKADATARAGASSAGRPAKVLSAAELAEGHPKVSVDVGFRSTTYATRSGSCFGWCWLVFTGIHCVAMFYGLSHGKVAMNKTLVAHAAWWHYVFLALFYIPFFLVGFAFTVASYRVELTDDRIHVRWRVLPYVGWTWILPVGERVQVSLAFRGSERNNNPAEAIVVASAGKDIDFGAFLALDVKEHLAGAIRHHYAGEEGATAPFLAGG